MCNQQLSDQWCNMIDRGIIPVIEYPIVGNNYLTVDIMYSPKGLLFELSEEGETRFSAKVVGRGSISYYLPFDQNSDQGLDHYLQEINQEVTEGFLIPNQLQNH